MTGKLTAVTSATSFNDVKMKARRVKYRCFQHLLSFICPKTILSVPDMQIYFVLERVGVFLCVYMCEYVFVFVNVFMRRCAYLDAFVHNMCRCVFVCLLMHLCVSVQACACVFLFDGLCVCVCRRVCVCLFP